MLSIDENQKTLYCANCGNKNHVYKKCKEPITSYGIICFRSNLTFQRDIDIDIDSTLNVDFLTIQRKHTVGFVEIIRGKYSMNDFDKLKNHFKNMTLSERNLLKNEDFESIWNNFWNSNNEYYKQEYQKACDKFTLLTKGFINDAKILIKLSSLLNITNEDNWKEAEWGFPKGRRNLKESDEHCAEREFIEETGLLSHNFILLPFFSPLEENYTGTNGIKYRHVYYIAEYLGNREDEIFIDKNNIKQSAEIANISWKNLEECNNNFRPYHIEKKNIINKVYNMFNILYYNLKKYRHTNISEYENPLNYDISSINNKLFTIQLQHIYPINKSINLIELINSQK